MKKILILTFALLLITTLGFAKPECITCPPGPQGEQGEQGLPGQDGQDGQDGLDGKNGTDYNRDDAIGIGVDIVVWENKVENPTFESVEVQEKYDFVNEENSVYVVGKVNIEKILNKVFKKKTEPVQ